MPDLTAPFYRADPITGTQVIYAPQRAERSNAFAADACELPGGPCPFCPGNEAETPPELDAVRPDRSAPNTPGWKIRLVPNRFPAVGEPPVEGTFDTGRHAVLIEAAEHDLDWATMSVEQLSLVTRTVQTWLQGCEADQRLHAVQIFKNVGIRAGASLAHPHLQLVAFSKAPVVLLREVQRSQEWLERQGYDYWGRFIDEARDQSRVIFEDAECVSLCPPVSRVPYEAWLLPKRPGLTWSDCSPAELHAWSDHLRGFIRRVHAVLGPVAHNVIWRLPPLRTSTTAYYRWRLEFLPRLTTFAGFELGIGIYSNPILPTMAVEKLRR